MPVGKAGTLGARTDALPPLCSTQDPQISLQQYPASHPAGSIPLPFYLPTENNPLLTLFPPFPPLCSWHGMAGEGEGISQRPYKSLTRWLLIPPALTYLALMPSAISPAAPHKSHLIVLAVNQDIPYQFRLTPMSWREQWLQLLSTSVLGYEL